MKFYEIGGGNGQIYQDLRKVLHSDNIGRDVRIEEEHEWPGIPQVLSDSESESEPEPDSDSDDQNSEDDF